MSQLIQKQQFLKEAAGHAINEAGLDGIASDILTNVVIDTIKKYQQKVVVGIEDSVGDILTHFKQTIANAVFSAVAGWKVPQREPFVFPQNCRFCFQKGTKTVFVIEQEPKIRSLFFKENMLGETIAGGDLTDSRRVSLAMPFAIFVIVFDAGVYQTMYHFWDVAPMRSLEDVMFQPLLPNVHCGGQVCIGYDQRPMDGTQMSAACHKLIGDFWNTQFNNDLSEHWWKKKDIDRRLASARDWEAMSDNDSLFILDVDFPEANGKTLKQAIDLALMHEQEPDENALRHKLWETLDKLSEELFHRITTYIKKTKFEKHHPKDVKDVLVEKMKSANEEFIDIVFALKNEMERLANEIKPQPKPTIKVGEFWSPYNT